MSRKQDSPIHSPSKDPSVGGFLEPNRNKCNNGTTV